MNVTVLLFAGARRLAQTDRATLELPPAATCADLRAALAARYPELAPLASRSALAIDGDYAPDHAPLNPSAEIALIPPVSGG